MTNRLVEIMKLGQSIWYDNIRRAMLVSGDLKIREMANLKLVHFRNRSACEIPLSRLTLKGL